MLQRGMREHKVRLGVTVHAIMSIRSCTNIATLFGRACACVRARVPYPEDIVRS